MIYHLYSQRCFPLNLGDLTFIIVSSYQHCDEQQFQTLARALYTIFFSNKARFSHTSTVTRLHSCSGKIIRVRIACIFFLYRNQYFLTFIRQNVQQKVLVFHSGLAPGSLPQPCSKRADTILYYYFHIKEEHFKIY